MLVIGGSAHEGEVMDEEKRQDADNTLRIVAHHYGGEPKNRSGDQSHHHQAVFNVIAFLECVIPEVECLCYMAAKTNQQKQKRTELKKLLTHYTVLGRPIPRAEEVAPPNYTSWLHRKLLICQKEAAGTSLSPVVG